MQIRNHLIRNAKFIRLLLAVTAIATPLWVQAQEATINLPLKVMTSQEVFDAIQKQTHYDVAVNMSRFRKELKVQVTQSPVTVKAILDKLFRNSGMTYATEGDYIIIPVPAPSPDKEPAMAKQNQPVKTVQPKPADNIAKAEVAPNPRVILIPLDKITRKRETITVLEADLDSATMDSARYTYLLVEPTHAARAYRPKTALKTNLLTWATTTPNAAIEFAVARKWTLNLAAAYNPWDLNSRKGGIRHWLVQPEARYWFCNAFERHFVGLHGIYGQYQISDIKLPIGRDLTGKRYDGWGVGAGLSYGYHRPLSPRWAMEFSIGAGYVYLDYKKYNCGKCSNYQGLSNRHYIGPTKAAISLIYMIK